MILRPGETAVAVRTADHEAAGRVDEVTDVAAEHLLRDDRLDDLLDHCLAQLRVRDVGAVLRRDDDGVDRDRLAVEVAHGELGLRVGAQPRQSSVAAHLGLPLHDAVGVVDGQRHQLRGLVARVAEHEALVTRALIEIEPVAFVHALGDVGRLAVDRGQHGARLVVEADLRGVVADLVERRRARSPCS